MSDWVFILRPAKSDVPPEVRVRRALKALRRLYDLPAIHIDQLEPGQVAPAIGAINSAKRPRVQT